MQGVTLTPPKKESCPQDSKYYYKTFLKVFPSIEETTITRYEYIYEYEMWKYTPCTEYVQRPHKVYHSNFMLLLGIISPSPIRHFVPSSFNTTNNASKSIQSFDTLTITYITRTIPLQGIIENFDIISHGLKILTQSICFESISESNLKESRTFLSTLYYSYLEYPAKVLVSTNRPK